VGISADQVDEQHQFDELNDLGFTLLSDADRIIGPVFDAERAEGPTYRRLTFVIDQDSTVLAKIDSETDMDIHADLALDTLRSAEAAIGPPNAPVAGGWGSSWRRLRAMLRRTRT